MEIPDVTMLLATLAVWLAKGALLAGLALGLATACRRAPAAVRHAILTAGALGILLLPFAGALGPARELPWLPPSEVGERAASPLAPAPGAPVVASPGPMASPPAEDSGLRSPGPEALSPAAGATPAVAPTLPAPVDGRLALLVALLAPALLLCGRMVVGLAGLARLRGRASEAVAAAELLADVPGGARVALLTSGELAVPVTFGLLRPVVVLPAAAASWTEAQRRQALLHELAHVARRDWLWQLASRLVCALHWPNPLVWLLARRLTLAAEQACDDALVRARVRPESYAEQLVELARSLRRRRGPATAAVAMARPSGLARRVEALLDARRSRAPLAGRWLLGTTLGLLGLLAFVGPTTLVAAAGADQGDERATPSGGWSPIVDDDDLGTALEGELELERFADEIAGLDHEIARGLDAADLRAIAATSSGPDREASRALQGRLLYAAVEAGDASTVERLLAAGFPVDVAVPGDGSPLIAAARRGDLTLVDRLLTAGADPDFAVSGDGSPLIQAAIEGHLAVAERLLAAGAEIDLVVPGDENPLIRAAGAGHLSLVKLLVARGAAVDARVVADTWERGRTGTEARTPLGMAIRGGHGDVARYLRSVGATEEGDASLVLPVARGRERDDAAAGTRGDGHPAALVDREGAKPPVSWLSVRGRTLTLPRGSTIRFAGHGALEWPRPGEVVLPRDHHLVVAGRRLDRDAELVTLQDAFVVDPRGQVAWRISPVSAALLAGPGTRITDGSPRAARIDAAEPTVFFLAVGRDGRTTYFAPADAPPAAAPSAAPTPSGDRDAALRRVLADPCTCHDDPPFVFAGSLGEPPGRDAASILPLLSERDPRMRAAAAVWLGQTTGARATTRLVRLLDDPSCLVAAEAAKALDDLPPSGEALPALLDAVSRPACSLRAASAWALGGYRDTATTRVLLVALGDPDDRVREAAASSLGSSRSRAAVEPLTQALLDPSAHVRQAAADALGQLRDRRAAEPLRLALSDPSAHVRQAAAEALDELGS